MSIETPEELERLKAAGRVVARAIRAMRAHVRPGVTTGELDRIGGGRVRAGRRPDGFYADACVSVPVADATASTRALAAASRTALNAGLATAHAGVAIGEVGRVVEAAVTEHGYAVCRELMGHGIGRRIHEAPNIPSYNAPGFSQPLTEGLVITIEPIIAARSGQVSDGGDGWPIKTQDGGYSAHSEHTIVVTQGAPVILTA